MINVNLKLTLPKGYIVLDSKSNQVDLIVLQEVLSLASKLEKKNFVLDSRLLTVLCSLDKESIADISENLLSETKSIKGEFLRSSFATVSDLEQEQLTLAELVNQLFQYAVTYSLDSEDMVDFFNQHKIHVKRNIEKENISKRADKQDINSTFKIISVKTLAEFTNEIASILKSPIVFGDQEISFIKEAVRLDLLENIGIKKIDFKVKENMFAIASLLDPKAIREYQMLKTATDVLRYAYWVSDGDYQTMPKGYRFYLKTSQKNLIMETLNYIRPDVAFSEMKPRKSQFLGLARTLYPGAKKFNKFPIAQEAFDIIRNKSIAKHVVTFNSVAADFIDKGEIIELAKHLANKPGELLRSLDMIIRKLEKGEARIISEILKGTKLNPKLVIQVMKRLEYRINTKLSERTFNVKGVPVIIGDKPLVKLKKKRTNKIIRTLENSITEHLVGKELFLKKETK